MLKQLPTKERKSKHLEVLKDEKVV